MTEYNLTIDPEFRDLLPEPNPKSRAMLAGMLIEAGRPRDAVVVWLGHGIIVDGHTRYAICKEHGLQYDITEVAFPDRNAVKNWIDRNQLARRNLDAHDYALLLVRIFTRHVEAGTPGGARKATSREADVAEKTVDRARRYVDALHSLKPDIQAIVTKGGELRARQGDVVLLAFHPETAQREIIQQVRSGEFTSLGSALHGEGTKKSKAVDTPAAIEAADKMLAEPEGTTCPLEGIGESVAIRSSTPADRLKDAQKRYGAFYRAMDALKADTTVRRQISEKMRELAQLLDDFGEEIAAAA